MEQYSGRSQKRKGPSITQAFMRTAAMLVVGVPLALGLGFMQDAGNQKAAEDLRDRLTEDQTEMIEYAVEKDQCSMLHSRHANLCYRVQRGDVTLDM